MNEDALRTKLRAEIRRAFPAGEVTELDIQVLDTEAELGRKCVVLTDLGGGTNITNAPQLYWGFVCERLGVAFEDILAIERYPGEDLRVVHGSVVNFLAEGHPHWRGLTDEERTAGITAHLPEALSHSPGR
ncbi:MAG: hypothetical protein B7Z66_14875 [Chromatiales bacterium 21-64-14]|nr:MAG: hypothetical protein B7Z66_14875 [Chromatiales bacterium 21-64-14]